MIAAARWGNAQAQAETHDDFFFHHHFSLFKFHHRPSTTLFLNEDAESGKLEIVLEGCISMIRVEFDDVVQVELEDSDRHDFVDVEVCRPGPGGRSQ
jgi:hypothetical protein